MGTQIYVLLVCVGTFDTVFIVVVRIFDRLLIHSFIDSIALFNFPNSKNDCGAVRVNTAVCRISNSAFRRAGTRYSGDIGWK